MAHGTPDWGVTAGAVTTYQLTDLAELAVRLGSIDTFDRRGDVIWLDSFADGLNKWGSLASGTGAAVGLSVARARNGQFCALLTAGSDASRSAEIGRLIALPVLSRLGCEVSFSLGSAIDLLDLVVDVFDGTNQVEYYVWWDADAETLNYLDVNGDAVILATGVDPWRSATLFHTWKVVVEASAREWVRVILDDRQYSLAGVAGYVIGPGSDRYLRLTVRLWGHAGENDTVYVDDPIITQNEPA